MIIANQRIRLAIDTSQMTSINDVLTGNTPQFWNGVDLQFELGIFRGAALADISNFDSITVELKTSADRTGQPLMSKVLSNGSFNNSLSLNAWNAGSAADSHALVAFSNSETNLFLSDDSVTFWLVISALTNDTPAHKIVLGATPLNVVEGGEGVTPPAYVTTPIYYTAAQSDARYTLSVDLSGIESSLSALDSEMTAVTSTANACMPRSGGIFSGSVTITGLSGVLKTASGLISGSATTSDLPEGSNLYWSNGRLTSALAAVTGTASGICPLDSGSKIPVTYLPSVAVSNTYVVASQSAMLALSANVGDVAIRTDLSETFILATTPASTLGNWKQMLSPTSAVTSVNSQTGTITLTTSNIAEGTNLYYTTARAKADAIAASLTGFSSSSGGTVSSGDSILSALGKLENRGALNDGKVTGSDRVKLDGTTAMTGMLNFSGTGHAGLLLNNLTDPQRAALTASAGMLIYNTTLSQPQYYNGSSWSILGSGGSSGTTLLTGSGTPSSGTGTNGNFYLDSSTGDFYLKTSGSWSLAAPGKLSLSGGTLSSTLTLANGLEAMINLGDNIVISADTTFYLENNINDALMSVDGSGNLTCHGVISTGSTPVQVVGHQQAAISQGGVYPTLDYTIHSSTVTGVDKEARQALNDLISRLSASTGGHGLLA
jgi:hypothetical protein